MFRLSLCVPDETVNYIKNPNCRYDTTDYSAAGATLTRTLDYARFGVASLKVVTAGTAIREGFFYRVNALQGISGPLTASAYVIGTGVVRLRLIDNPTGKEWVSETVTLRTDRWTRLSASGVITGSNDVRLYVETNEGAAKVRTFYTGGLQMERKAYMTTFCDGDQPGCRWNGIYHASASQRAGDTRAGGRWVQMGGDGREEEDLYITVVGGLGMAPLTNNTQSFALAPGSYFQNRKVTDRIITLTFHAKHKTDERENSISLARLHELRQFLLDTIKPDLTGGDEDILFEYDDGNLPLYFRARYDGGLEGEWDVRNQWVNSFPLRLLATEPFLFEDNQAAQQLDFQESLTVSHAIGKIDRRWTNLNYGLNNFMRQIAFGPRGEVYAVGNFSIVNNNANAIDPLRPARAAYWDGEKWVAIATSLGGVGAIYDIVVAVNGDVYVTGDFTSVNGVSAVNIARWDGTTWSALSTGLTGGVPVGWALDALPNGDIIVGGNFTTGGGLTNCGNIARWDGSRFHRLGQYGGMNSDVYVITHTSDGATLYVGGLFTDERGNPGNTLNRIAQYNMTTGLFSAMGSGFNTSFTSGSVLVLDLLLAPNGILYAIGNFKYTSSVLVNGVAQWGGNSWTPLGIGLGHLNKSLSGVIADLEWGDLAYREEDGLLIVIGYFDLAGGNYTPLIGYWNGSTWVLPDLLLTAPASVSMFAVGVRDNGDLFMGGSLSASYQVLVPGFTTIDNPGDAEAYPIIYIKGPAQLRGIENQSGQKRLYLNLTLLTNEEITLDFGKGTMQSNYRGNVLYGLLPGSDFRAFTLIPGKNKLACFMVDDVNAQMSIQYTPRHWGADARG